MLSASAWASKLLLCQSRCSHCSKLTPGCCVAFGSCLFACQPHSHERTHICLACLFGFLLLLDRRLGVGVTGQRLQCHSLPPSLLASKPHFLICLPFQPCVCSSLEAGTRHEQSKADINHRIWVCVTVSSLLGI